MHIHDTCSSKDINQVNITENVAQSAEVCLDLLVKTLELNSLKTHFKSVLFKSQVETTVFYI